MRKPDELHRTPRRCFETAQAICYGMLMISRIDTLMRWGAPGAAVCLFALLIGPATGEVPHPGDFQDELAIYYDGGQVAEWPAQTVDEKPCVVSPPLDAGPGCELNHNRVIVDFVGDGEVELSVMHFTTSDPYKALEKPYNHTSFQKIESGRETVVFHMFRGHRAAWLLLRTTGDARVSDVRWVAWRGKGTLFGHAPGSFEFAGAKLPYRLMYPRNYDPAKSYPLVLSVSGSGGVGSDNARNMENVILARFLFARYYHLPQLECFSLVPQIPPAEAIPAPYFPQGPRGRPDVFHPDWPAVNEQGWYAQATLALIESLCKNTALSIDKDRVYYSGFSYGGKGCWEFLKAGREVFAAAICGAGWPIGPPYATPTGELLARLKQEVQRYKHIPVLIFVGAKDGMRNGSKAVHELIESAGGQSTYVEFPDTNHVNSAAKGWGSAKNIEWLFEQNRRKNPPAGPDPQPEGTELR